MSPVPVKVEFFCPSCLNRLDRNGDVVHCVNRHCEGFRVRYAVPEVTMRRLAEQFSIRDSLHVTYG